MINLPRRTLLASASALAAAPFIPDLAFAETSAPPKSHKDGMQFDDPQHNLDAVIRLKGGTDNQTRYFSGVGRAFAVFEDEMAVPLFDAKVAAWERNKKQDDGSYIRQTAFVQYHYDIGGGPSDKWKNPVTGKVTELPVFKNEFGEVQFTTRGSVTAPEMQVESLEGDAERIYPWVVMGNDVWLPKDEMASYFSQREQRRLIENSVRTYHTSLDALNDLSLPSIPATMIESAASKLFGFLDMPEEKRGYMMWRFVSKKHERVEEISDDIRKEIDSRNPEVWKNA